MMFTIISMVNGQSTSVFADGEAKRVYDLLNGLECIVNSNCPALADFTPASACDSAQAISDVMKPVYSLTCKSTTLFSIDSILTDNNIVAR
jgi:hypothetical protein